MDAFVDTHALSQTSFGSSALGVLGMIAHPLIEGEGTYVGTVFRNKREVGRFRLEIDDKVEATQATINLAAIADTARGAKLTQPVVMVNPKAYLLIYVSEGAGGFHVILRKQGARRARTTFDSRKLQPGDRYILTLLRPGRYSIENATTRAKGKATVEYLKPGSAPYRPPDPVTTECTPNTFKPANLKLKPGQGLVFNAAAISVIRLKLDKPDDGGRKLKPLARWVSPRIKAKAVPLRLVATGLAAPGALGIRQPPVPGRRRPR